MLKIFGQDLMFFTNDILIMLILISYNNFITNPDFRSLAFAETSLKACFKL